MRIAIMINTSWNIYNFRLGLIKALQQDGHQIIAIAPKDEFSEKLQAEGCEFYDVPMEQKGANPIKDLQLKNRMQRALKGIKPDVLLLYTIKPNIYGTLAAAKLGIPVINNVSGLGTVFIRNGVTSRIAKYLYKKAFKKSRLIFFQNKDDRNDFVNAGLLNENKTQLLPGSGVDLTKFNYSHKDREEEFVVLMISRVIYDKGVMEFVEAIKGLKQSGNRVKAVLVGFIEDGNYLGIPRATVNEWVDEGVIDFKGAIADVRPLIAAADIVVLPSYREGTPKSLLEALAMGKPIVTTDVPGCREVVKDGENGFLCKVKDASDLADKVLKMFRAKDTELTNMGLKSRALAEKKFDEKIVISQYRESIIRLNNK